MSKTNKLVSKIIQKSKKDEKKEEDDFFTLLKKSTKEVEENFNMPLLEEMAQEAESGWLNQEEEGQLSVDVYQTDDSIIIKSTIAGVKPEDIEISVNNGMLTIRGKRQREENIEEKDYFYQECYWGNFSRSIILPTEVKEDKIKASLKNGVLTIVLPKVKRKNKLKIKVEE